MKIKKGIRRNLLIYSTLSVSVLLVFLYVFKTQKLQEEVDRLMSNAQAFEDKNQTYRELLSLDSLLLIGKYQEALDTYQNLYAKDSALTGEILLRIRLSEKLLNDSQKNSSTEKIDTSAGKDSLILTRTATPLEVRQYDSLSFALDKALLRLEKVSTQLEERSFGEYLEFNSSKGNVIYYVGQVKKGKANGRGVGLFATGSRYEGNWKNNLRNGEGTYFWPDGQYYVGNYVNDKRQGTGTYFWPNGDKFVGDWQNDQRNGQGTFYNKDGKVVASGLWKNDELVKKEKK
ncbi:MAG: hypothetical protein AAF519_06360 [Bacteroidota bacterium]